MIDLSKKTKNKLPLEIADYLLRYKIISHQGGIFLELDYWIIEKNLLKILRNHAFVVGLKTFKIYPSLFAS